MYSLELSAGSSIQLTATALVDAGIHRWNIQVFTLADPETAASPRLAYGSEIGGGDIHQRVNIPWQDANCRLDVSSRHAAGGEWRESAQVMEEISPGQFTLGFSRAAKGNGAPNDVTLTFAITPASS